MVREAIMYAIDRDGVNKLVCDGYGTPTYMYINPNYAAAAPAADSLKNPIPFDLEKAKQLLADAGYPDGIQLGDFIAAAGRNESYAIAIHAQLEAAGIHSTLVVQDYSVAGDRLVAQEYDLAMAY
ncbi:MAG: ABC transporter substrate-binding protein [Intestinimonas sp.]